MKTKLKKKCLIGSFISLGIAAIIRMVGFIVRECVIEFNEGYYNCPSLFFMLIAIALAVVHFVRQSSEEDSGVQR